MTDVSELKNLLKEIGFPLEKENYEKNDINKLEEELKEKIKSNQEERKFIINQYNKHNNFCKLIKLKEEKIDELTSSLGNLIDTESEQKMREEEYKNELVELLKVLKQNNNFNNPREGY
jgi:K+/H+ antiporter YhaU regulatory subunit KhtT